ncbi:MAG: type II toxin-antitoxin system RelE/ParE family toxin [Balneolaceae bacterium]|nr:type II toxin-antitoxin system RelE/ParE family toxin [Balneolaceae bacterium]
MALNVLWTQSAQMDRIRLYRFWNEKTGDSDYSKTIHQIIEDKLFQTRLFPDCGVETDRKEIRYHLIEKQYKLFYSIRNNSILVLRLTSSLKN